MNGRPSYNPHSKTLPGVPERKSPPLKLVASNDDARKGKSE